MAGIFSDRSLVVLGVARGYGHQYMIILVLYNRGPVLWLAFITGPLEVIRTARMAMPYGNHRVPFAPYVLKA